MNPTTITAWAAMATAVAAMLGPSLTAKITAVSNERMQKYEISQNRIGTILEKLTNSYADLIRNTQFGPVFSFRVAAYQLLSCQPNKQVRDKLKELLAVIDSQHGESNEESDVIFMELLDAIAETQSIDNKR